MKTLAQQTITLFLILGCFSISDAQINSSTYNADETTKSISFARESITSNINSTNVRAVKFIRDSLRNKYENDKHIPFFPAEYWLLCLYTKDYPLILTDNYLNDISKYYQEDIFYPVIDNMGQTIRNTVRLQYINVQKDVEASTLSTKDKALMNLILLFAIHSSYEVKDTLQLTINDLAKKYLSTYPDAKEKAIIQTYVIKEYVSDNRADEMILGGGYFMPIGKIAKHVSNGYSLGFDYLRYFGNNFAAFTANMITGKLTDSAKIKNIYYKKDAGFSSYFLGAEIGTKFINTKRIDVIGYLGATYTNTGLSDTTKNKTVYFGSVSAKFGIAIDFVFLKIGRYAAFKKRDDFNHTNFFRLKYEYCMPNYGKTSPDIQGGIHNITLSLGFNTQKISKK